MIPQPKIRPPAVAGYFYPAEAPALRAAVEDLLAAAPPMGHSPKALIAPHAGYLYSGAIAAAAFVELAAVAEKIRRVVLLGPAHRVSPRGLGHAAVKAFATPLGKVPVDREMIETLSALPQVIRHPLSHRDEHCLEVELPFLQVVLGEFTLVPLVVGDASTEEVEEVLEAAWGGPETLIVISSDLSHYLPYQMARQLDRDTADWILALRGPLSTTRACGATSLNGLLAVARRRGLTCHLLDLRNSGDTAGNQEQVVGYGAFALTEPGQEAPGDEEAAHVG